MTGSGSGLSCEQTLVVGDDCSNTQPVYVSSAPTVRRRSQRSRTASPTPTGSATSNDRTPPPAPFSAPAPAYIRCLPISLRKGNEIITADVHHSVTRIALL